VLQGDLAALIERRWEAREHRTRRRPPILSSFVFHQRHGRPVSYSTYRREFVAACEAAKIEGRTTHDFRWTVARDLRRAGVPETVAMSITGHETVEIFRRYSIVDTRDRLDALRAKDALIAAERSKVRAMPKR
jgi:integrase